MIDNLKFYGISILLGFIVSLWWWNEENKKLIFPWPALIVPIFWTLSASAFIVHSNINDLSYLQAIPQSIDVRHFYRGYGMIELRSPGALAMFAIATFALFFRSFWNWRNLRSQ